MRESEYRRYRKEIEAEHKAAATALANVEAKLSALDLVWTQVLRPDATDKGTAESADLEVINTTQRKVAVNGHAQMLIDEAAGGMDGDFGVKEIEGAVQVLRPDVTVNRTTIAGRLRKLVVEGKLECITAGRGRLPGIFRRVA